jgi:hypothetical protein
VFLRTLLYLATGNQKPTANTKYIATTSIFNVELPTGKTTVKAKIKGTRTKAADNTNHINEVIFNLANQPYKKKENILSPSSNTPNPSWTPISTPMPKHSMKRMILKNTANWSN